MDAIIEEALRSILNEALVEPAVTESIPEPVVSEAITSDTVTESNRRTMDISMSFVEEPSYHSVLEGLKNHLDDYHRNIRLYQQNISQMNRMYQNMIQSATPIRRTPRSNRNINQSNAFASELLRMTGGNQQGRFIEFYFPGETARIPTAREIENATDRIVYSPSLELNTRTCPITLEEFTNGEVLSTIRHCRHVFKQTALFNWFSRNSHCPVCRYDILSRTTL
jgi:hypothetical protein